MGKTNSYSAGGNIQFRADVGDVEEKKCTEDTKD